MFALNIDKETGRILSATYEKYASEDMPIVESLPEGSISDYLYIDGEYVHSPIPVEPVVVEPTQQDIIEAQIMYTAMMTDTLLKR